MAQQTGSERAQTASFATISALGGLLAFPAIVGYMAYLPIPALMAILAWRLWSPPVRRPFLVLAAGSLITGLVVRLLPHVPDGGVGGAGIALCVVVLFGQGIGVLKLRKREVELARSTLSGERSGKVQKNGVKFT